MGSPILLAMAVKHGCAQALVNSYSMWMEFDNKGNKVQMKRSPQFAKLAIVMLSESNGFVASWRAADWVAWHPRVGICNVTKVMNLLVRVV